jgi:hypothetical protein
VKANASQISVHTGLHRKDLRVRLHEPADRLPDTQRSQISRVIARWLMLVQQDESLARLPFLAPPEEWSLSRLVRMETGGDTHFKATMRDLARQGLVRVSDEHAEIVRSGFGATSETSEALAYLADNSRDHLAAAVQNVTEPGSRFIERSIFTENITPEAVQQIQVTVNKRWAEMYASAFEQMMAAERPHDPAANQRIKLGLYVYAEPMPIPSDPLHANPDEPAPQKPVAQAP